MDDGRNLFVYGTLMSFAVGSYGAVQRARLQREARLLGPAKVYGRLYDLGDFPGVVLEDETSSIVHGELVHLDDAEAALAWLDRYEEISPGGSPSDLYRRVRTMATLAGGEPIACWVYELQGPTNGFKLLPEGVWQSPSQDEGGARGHAVAGSAD